MKYFCTALVISLIGYASGQTVVNRCSAMQPGSFIRDYNDCEKYFQCHENGTTVPGACPSPYLFSEPQQMCNYPEQVYCSRCPLNNPSFYQYPVEFSCKQFLRCTNGIAQLLECPGNLYFDSITAECNLASQVNCTIPDVICPISSTPSSPSFVTDKNNCSIYYVCFGSVPITHNCPGGLHFNQNTTTCDLPSNANCTSNPIIPTNPPIIPTNPPIGTTSPPLIPPGIYFQCPYNGLFSHPSSCNLYIACLNGSAIESQCPFTLHFDPVNKRCDLPNGNCRRSTAESD